MLRVRPLAIIAVLSLTAILLYSAFPRYNDSLSLRFLSSQSSRSPTVQRLFEQSYDARDPPSFALSALQLQCGQTEWHDQIYIQCGEIFAGLTSIMSEVKTCFKMAVDLGYNLVIPAMAIRDSESLTEYNIENEKLHLPFGDWFDEEHLVSRLTTACPQMKIARLDEHKQPKVKTKEIMEYDLKTLQYYSGWGRYAWTGNEWAKQIHDNVTARMTKSSFTGAGNTILKIPARMAFFSILDDSTGHDLKLWNELNYLMRLKPEARAVLARLLDTMASIEGMRPYYGIHFRVEKDSTDAWIKSGPQIQRIAQALEDAWAKYGHEGKMNKVAYVACGDQDEVEKLRQACNKSGWIITDKWTLAKSVATGKDDLLKAIDGLPFDHQGMLDFGVLLLSEFFIGLTNSAFSFSIAHARDPRGRFRGSSLERMKDPDSRTAATHLFFDGEGAYPCCL